MTLFCTYLLLILPAIFAQTRVFTNTEELSSAPWINPASLIKIILVEKALKHPLPERFETKAYLPVCPNKICKEPLIITLNDPELSTPSINAFFSSISQTITEFKAPIYIHYKPMNTLQTGVFHEERYECFSALPTGIDLDKNCIWQTISPSTKTIALYDSVFTIKRSSLNGCRHQNEPSDFIQDLNLRAWINQHQKTFEICHDDNRSFKVKSHVKNPMQHFKQVIMNALHAHHINHQSITFTQRPAHISKNTTLKVISSTSKQQLLRAVLQKSDNFIAQFLFQSIGAPKLGPYIFDGSGLSRYNLIQPHTLNQGLKSLIKTYPWVKDLMLSEKDLNLKLPKDTHLYYKTGTLFPIKNILGLIEQPNHPDLFFTLSCSWPDPKECQSSLLDEIQKLMTKHDLTSQENAKALSQIPSAAI